MRNTGERERERRVNKVFVPRNQVVLRGCEFTNGNSVRYVFNRAHFFPNYTLK